MFKVGDTVEVLKGDYRGRTGRVTKVREAYQQSRLAKFHFGKHRITVDLGKDERSGKHIPLQEFSERGIRKLS
ncbi:KOW motif-containing protein [Candidatus Bathyarchaeota archaeon]|nr:KOW motif-containing protein [Candidatus Bathyarchaeota archaeon]